MTPNESIHISARQYALAAGLSLLLMAIMAGFSYGYVFNTIFVPNDAAATLRNILNSEGLFRAGILSFVGVLICDVVVAWGLYHFLKPVSKSLSGLAAWLRLVYAAIFGIAFVNLIILLQFTDASSLRMIEQTVREAHSMVFVRAFSAMWSLSLIVFGAHLFVLGILLLKSGFIPKIFGVLILLASVCYLANDSANLLFSWYGQHKPSVEKFISVPMAIAELALSLWLLIKGGKPRS